MSVKIPLPSFDGLRGPIQAQQFINSMTAIFEANNVQGDRRPHLAKAAFLANSPAAIWLANEQLCNATAFATWDDMKTAITDEFCRPLTMAQTQIERRKLVMKTDETANAFFNRVRFFHNNKDFNLADAVKTTAAYKDQLALRVKESFVEGLPADLLPRLAAVNMHTITNNDLLTAVLQAQALMPAASTSVNAISRFNKSRGKKGSSQGKPSTSSSNRSIPPPADRSKRPPPDVLRARSAQTCGRCRLMAKHRTLECFVKLDAAGNVVRTRRPVDAIDDSAAITDSDIYPDPLNSFQG